MNIYNYIRSMESECFLQHENVIFEDLNKWIRPKNVTFINSNIHTKYVSLSYLFTSNNVKTDPMWSI